MVLEEFRRYQSFRGDAASQDLRVSVIAAPQKHYSRLENSSSFSGLVNFKPASIVLPSARYGQSLTISRYARGHQGRHPSPADSPSASGSFELGAYQQEAQSGHNVSGLQPSYGIRNDPLPEAVGSGLGADRQITGLTILGLQIRVPPSVVPARLQAVD